MTIVRRRRIAPAPTSRRRPMALEPLWPAKDPFADNPTR